jgi:hypothetical protein
MLKEFLLNWPYECHKGMWRASLFGCEWWASSPRCFTPVFTEQGATWVPELWMHSINKSLTPASNWIMIPWTSSRYVLGSILTKCLLLMKVLLWSINVLLVCYFHGCVWYEGSSLITKKFIIELCPESDSVYFHSLYVPNVNFNIILASVPWF